MTVYVVEIDSSNRTFVRTSHKSTVDFKKIPTWKATLSDPSESVSMEDVVNIKRDGTTIFTGIVELTDPIMGPNGSFMEVGGRHISVLLWRKFNERYADTEGAWSDYYPNKIVQFLLYPSFSDPVSLDEKYRRMGWGIDPTTWDDATASSNSATAAKLINRFNTIGWESSGNQQNEWFKIDLGSAKDVCAIRFENRVNNLYARGYKVEISTNDSDWTEVVAKSINKARNVVETWNPDDEGQARYIKVTATFAAAMHWWVGEVFVYELDSLITGISEGTLTEHLPLNCSAVQANCNSGQADVVVYDGWRFQVLDDVILSDKNGQEEALEIASIALDTPSAGLDTLTMSTNLVNSYTTANEAWVANMDRPAILDLPYGRRSNTISDIIKLCMVNSTDTPWEWWVTNTGAVSMGATRGSDVSGSISFVYKTNLSQSSNKTDNRNKVDRAWVLGKGKGDEQDRNSSGWQGSGEYELIVQDGSLDSKELTINKARSLIEKSDDNTGQVVCTVEDTHATGDWNVGDAVTLTDSITGLSGTYRIHQLSRNYNENGEIVKITATSTQKTLANIIASISERNEKNTSEDTYPPERLSDFTGEVGFAYFLEAELLYLDASTSIETDDATASNGKYIKIAQAESGDVAEGTGFTLKPGSYRVVFKSKVIDNASSSDIVTIALYSTAKGSNFDSFTLQPDLYTTSDTWQLMSFTVNIDTDYTDIEFVIDAFQTGITDWECDWCGIIPNWVPDIPAGPPGTPANPVATAELGAVRVEWDHNTEQDLDHYIVYRDTSSTPTVEYRRLKSNEFVDLNVVWATTYYYRIKAVDWSQQISGYSGEVSAAPAYIDPADLDIELKPWTSDINVVWDDVADTPPTDWNHILWGQSGDEGLGGTNATITYADGTTRTVVANEDANVADGLWWIYWTSANTTLQWTQTYSVAVGAGKGLIGIVEINSAGSESPTILLFNSYLPTIGAGVIGAYSIYSKHISADWITGKNFRTAVGVGEGGGPSGMRFDANYISGYSGGTTKTFYLASADGKAYFLGGKAYLDEDGLNIVHNGIDTTTGIRFRDDGAAVVGQVILDIGDGVSLQGSANTYLGNIAATAYYGVIVNMLWLQSAGEIELHPTTITESFGDIRPEADTTRSLGIPTKTFRYFVPKTVVGSRPAAGADYDGMLWYSRAGAGNKGYLWVCMQNDANGYEWVQLGITT